MQKIQTTISIKNIFLGIVLVAATLLNSSETIGQNSSTFKWPKNEITPIFKEFVKAYNSNDLKKLEAFTAKYYEKDFVEGAAYWPSVFADFRQIEPYKVATDWSNKNRLTIWFLGKKTKNFVQISMPMNADNTKIIGKSVLRGLKPSGKVPPYQPITDKQMNAHLTAYLDELDNIDFFSGSVLVAKGNTVLFEKSYGKNNKKNNTKNNANTSFNIASTTKPFTALAIALLEKQGELKFTDPISQFMSEYQKYIADQVTIHHLLNHTSGIELDNYAPFNEDMKKAKNLNDALKAQVTHIDSLKKGRRKDFKVLNKYDYSNEEYALLGAIIERVSGMSYGDFIEKYILVPLNMQHTFSNANTLKTLQNKAIGYTYKDKKSNFINELTERQENGGPRKQYMTPEGGIYSTPRDLYTFFKAINNHKLVSKSVQQTLHTKHAKLYEDKEEGMHYGYGFKINREGTTEIIGHGGVAPGVGSQWYYYPKTDHYVMVLSNYGSMAGSAVSRHIQSVIESNY